MYAKEQIIRARIEIASTLQNLNALIFSRNDEYATTENLDVDLKLASEELEKLKDFLAFLK